MQAWCGLRCSEAPAHKRVTDGMAIGHACAPPSLIETPETRCPGVPKRSLAPIRQGVTSQVSVMVTEPVTGKVGMAMPPADCRAVTRAGPVVAGQTAPLVALPHTALVQVSPVGAGSVTTAPLAALGPGLVTTML